MEPVNFNESERNETDRKVLDELFDKVKSYRSSAEYKDLLDFIVRFPKLSPFNAFLIRTQNKGVNYVLNAKNWQKKYKRTIKDYARPLVILVPFGPVDFVYDIADTNGTKIPEELTNPFKTKGELSPEIYGLILKNLKSHGFTIDEYVSHKSLAGFAQATNGSFKIMLNNHWDAKVKLSTLFHELGHLFAGHCGANHESWWYSRLKLTSEQKEFEAESISFLVCKRLGLDTNSDEYLSGYILMNKEIPNISFETILTVAGYIESMTRSGFIPKKPKPPIANKNTSRSIFDP
jgi:hypothetical protein